MPKQAELRIYLTRSDGQAALAGRLTVRGANLYIATVMPGWGEAMRHSLHESGQSHLYITGETRRIRHEHPVDAPPADLRGATVLVSASAPSPLDPQLEWTYKPKPDRASRRNLAIEAETMPSSWSIDFWAIEPGRQDLVDAAVEELAARFQVLGHVLLDTTTPWILAVAWSIGQEKIDAMPG
jgi:hypothetical protein